MRTRAGSGSGVSSTDARASVEALHLHEHPEEARVARVPRVGEHAAEPARTRILEPAAVAAHGHAHVGGLRLDPELVEQPEQVRVRAVVVDDEPAVDREHALVGGEHVVGVRVTAQPRLGLVERHVVVALQDVRRGEAGDARADDGHRAAGRDRCALVLCAAEREDTGDRARRRPADGGEGDLAAGLRVGGKPLERGGVGEIAGDARRRPRPPVRARAAQRSSPDPRARRGRRAPGRPVRRSRDPRSRRGGSAPRASRSARRHRRQSATPSVGPDVCSRCFLRCRSGPGSDSERPAIAPRQMPRAAWRAAAIRG